MVLRIFEMIATSSFLTALECTKFVFGRGSAPDPTGGAYSAPPDTLAGLRGTNTKWVGEGKVKAKGEGKGREKEGETSAPSFANFWICSCIIRSSVAMIINKASHEQGTDEVFDMHQ